MGLPSLADFEASDAAIAECFRSIDEPQNHMLRTLLALWHTRPDDGLVVGRDIPSRRFAPLLSHILFWEPVEGGADFTLRLCGEALRLRFGDHALGKTFTSLIDPRVVPSFLEKGRAMMAEDHVACFDMNLMRKEAVDGLSQLHFEMVVFPVWAPNRSGRWILNGTYYFL